MLPRKSFYFFTVAEKFDALALVIFSLLMAVSVSARAEKLYLKNLDSDGDLVQVWVDCKIEDVATKCFLDTGGELEILATPIDALKSHPIVGSVAMGSVSGVPASCQQIILSEFFVFGKKLQNLKLTRCDSYDQARSPNIGVKIFDAQKVLLDFPHTDFEWVNAVPLTLSKLETLERANDGEVILPAKLGSNVTKVMFDTGSTASMVDSNYVAANPDQFSFLQEVDAADGTNQTVKAKLYTAKNFSMGNKVFNERTNVFLAVDFSGYLALKLGPNVPFVLGMLHMKQFAWFLDLQNNRWSLR